MSTFFKEAVSKRIYDLCCEHDFTPNKLAKLSAVAPSTLQDMLLCKVENPSSYIIFKICKTLKISMQEFFDKDIFDIRNIKD